jgi:hypothetical protein
MHLCLSPRENATLTRGLRDLESDKGGLELPHTTTLTEWDSKPCGQHRATGYGLRGARAKGRAPEHV